MSVYEIFTLLVFNRECMERKVMTSFRLLSSFECFLLYFQTAWSFLFTLQCELFRCCNVLNNVSLVSARTGRVWWSTKCGHAWTGGAGVPKIQICADILYAWPRQWRLTCKKDFFAYSYLFQSVISFYLRASRHLFCIIFIEL